MDDIDPFAVFDEEIAPKSRASHTANTVAKRPRSADNDDSDDEENNAAAKAKISKDDGESKEKDTAKATKEDSMHFMEEQLMKAHAGLIEEDEIPTVVESKDEDEVEIGDADGDADGDERRPRETITVKRYPQRFFAGEGKGCSHEVALPPNSLDSGDIPPPLSPNPFRTYPFELDPFQKESISCLENGESVLVSAHTSAGKTVVAEYAIAMSLKNHQRVIYTSPIKALSNQKYRELQEEFSDVGLMTGDVTINPNSSCLVMTTEILRSMLYRGSEIMREVAWVVFDEIHYMRDKERGVVWEETIILLPDKVRYVFLSATIPNALEFAQWIAKLHRQPCHVVYTDYRPVPLQHYIFPAGGEGLYLVVDEKGKFREDNFQKALSSIVVNESSRGKGGRGMRRKAGPGGSDIYKIVKMIMERSFQPCIVFCFSKRECEGLALQMAKLDFNTEQEKKLVDTVFQNAIDSLSEDDRKLPQIENILPLLRRGIGIHHGGLLPILKEVIEILFQEGLIKALFATETFSIGLNMPAKTVVFTSVRKFDGDNFRWVTSGEYIQMSGRAGRRGLDERGIVILMVDEKMEPSVAHNMVQGQPDRLNSAFHITYNMLLNLMRVEGVDTTEMLRKSFRQFQTENSRPDIETRLDALNDEKKQIEVKDESVVAELYNLKAQLAKINEDVRITVNKPINCLKFLQPGRLVKVLDGTEDWGWGVVVNFQKRQQDKSSNESVTSRYVVDVVLHCQPIDKSAATTAVKPQMCPLTDKGEMQVVPVSLALLNGFSSLRIVIPKDLRSSESRQSVGKSLREVLRRFPSGIPMLDPIQDMKIEDEVFKASVRKVEALESRITSNPDFKAQDIQARMLDYERKVQLETQIKTLKKEIRSSNYVILKDELKAMKRVLRRLGYIDGDNVIQLKGRVACEINTADELLITELIFSNLFNDLTVEQNVSLLSCTIWEEKSDEKSQLAEELSAQMRKVTDTAKRIAKVSQESKLSIDTEQYLQRLKPQLMDIIYSWCNGAKFIDLCKSTTVFEG
eukprot:TRINITY_DN541_c0_g1_i1.p1 TRINITY_DN541_c0_g1~~TRINITY_DN541_c0_g1_i1.p1  ORF type:complete len:1028 (-),score=254.82 TRINITY_DN541_c0_g1_i1:2032-5115(-)